MFDRLHPLSALAGCALGLMVLVAMGQKPVAGEKWEYSVETDVGPKDIGKLTAGGWVYEGYLGTSVKGAAIDETLWRRPKK